MTTKGDSEEPRVEMVPLDQPRPLTPSERAIVDFLLAGSLGREELKAQALTAHAVATCSCGCPSVDLAVDPQLPRAEFNADERRGRDDDYVAITAYQPKSRGWTEVTLHVHEGALNELEIWSGEYGVRPRVDVAKLVRTEDITHSEEEKASTYG